LRPCRRRYCRPSRRDRLAELQRALADVEQAAPVVDRFHEGHDDLDVVALDEIGNPVEQREIGLVAGGNRIVAAHSEVGRYRHHAEAEAAALRHHRHRPRLQRLQLGGAAEADAGVVLEIDDAQAVRADHAHVRLARGLYEALLQRLAFRADLAEAAGEHERERNAGFAALLNGARHVRRGRAINATSQGFPHGVRSITGQSLDPSRSSP
jgi:hypothetical protein